MSCYYSFSPTKSLVQFQEHPLSSEEGAQLTPRNDSQDYQTSNMASTLFVLGSVVHVETCLRRKRPGISILQVTWLKTTQKILRRVESTAVESTGELKKWNALSL